MSRRWRIRAWTSLTCLWLAGAAFAQSGAPTPQLHIDTSSLPPAIPQQAYRFPLVASSRGTIPPLKWDVVQGDLPAGLKLGTDGVLSGIPAAAGEFHFTARVTDESQPPATATRELAIKIVQALVLEWKNYPRLSGNQILGSAAVTNGTEDTFDFTFFVVAVNEIGKAFALGYQRLPLRPGTASFEIAFGQGQNLPQGTYTVHVDGVGELDAKGPIYHRRLQTKEPLTVAVGP